MRTDSLGCCDYASVALSEGDRVAVDAMKRIGGFASTADLLRVALANQARIMDVPITAKEFRVTGRRDPRVQRTA